MTIKPLCRDADDDTKFCQFAEKCHEPRQRIQNHHLVRGNDCWAYKLMTQGERYPGDVPAGGAA